MKIAFVYYSAFSSFIKKDYDIISKHHEVCKINCQKMADIKKMMTAIPRCDLSFIWFAGGHALLAVLLCKLFKKKSLIVVGGFDVAKVPQISYGRFTQGWTKRLSTKLALRYADKVLVVDPSLKEDAIRNAQIDGHNIDYLPTGYDGDRFKPGGDKEDLVITVGYVSVSVIKRKGFDTFVKAASFLPDARFLLIGKPVDESLESLKKFAPENVEFTGFVSDEELLRYYQRAKVYCQLSAYEGLPNALCEAMLCECIPVGTKRNGIPTAMGDTGFYVPYGDPEATAVAVKKALQAPKDLGSSARARIIDLFPEKRSEAGLLRAINGAARHEVKG
ncbi:MAG: glycosyltransferase family 4 protein [Methanothrix sp.]|nr:glycosyltransferase family 4 protein [Methanothrix sp.]